MAATQKFSKYKQVDDDDDDFLKHVAVMGLGDSKSTTILRREPPKQSVVGAPALAASRQFEELRLRLLSTFQDGRIMHLPKLETYMTAIQEALGMSYLTLFIMSRNHWLQTKLQCQNGAISLPSAAEEIHPYSFSRQLSEILQDDPSAVTMESSVSKDLPPDLQKIAAEHGVREFVVHAVSNGEGEMIGALVCGHEDGKPFADRAGWKLLHSTLQCILWNTVVGSNLDRYILFSETIKACRTPQDMMVIISMWLPYLLLGEWGSCGECRMAIVRSTQVTTVYKAVKKRKKASTGDTGSKQLEASQSKQFNLKRMSSTSKILRSGSMVAKAPNEDTRNMILGHCNPLLDLLGGMVPLEVEHLEKCKDECTVYYKHLPLKGTLLENVIMNEVAVCIHDVQKHINDNPDGHGELLFNEAVVLPKSLLLLPMYKDTDSIYGGIYLDCFIKHDLSHVQFEAEILLLIASVLIQQNMRHIVAGAPEGSDLPASSEPVSSQQAALRSHVSQTIGSATMEHFSSRHNLAALQKVFTGIITDYSAYEEPPQICEPEHIHIGSVAGRGAFGTVYQGWIEGVNTISAVKVMMLSDKMDGMALLRNATEMAAMSKINHPNTVHIMAYFMDVVMLRVPTEGSGPFFRRTRPEEQGSIKNTKNAQRCSVVVMEYCAFGTLLHAMNLDVFRTPEPNSRPDVEMICSVLLELASSLMFLHKHGIIHCDLKPQNVLLKVDSSNPRGFVTKLADFGLARVVTQASPGLMGDSAGTPTHLAPEIVKVGDKQSWKTFKADVYAFGILMWELYTSEEAFNNIDKMHVLTKVALQRVRPKYPHGVPPAYASLSERCWAHDPDDRPTFEVVKQELIQIMEAHGSHHSSALQTKRSG